MSSEKPFWEGKTLMEIQNLDKRVKVTMEIGELADVLQTVGNLITAFDITDEELAQSMDDCLVRNQERGRL